MDLDDLGGTDYTTAIGFFFEYSDAVSFINAKNNKSKVSKKEKELNRTQNKLYQYEGKVEDLTAKLKELQNPVEVRH